jgi:DNA modification methylase
VLDPFSGSATTGQVAINMGCDYIGVDGKSEYADLGAERIETPWVPVAERRAKKSGKKRVKKSKQQRELFT